MFDMFGENVATPLPALELQDAEATKAEMLTWERELLGVYVSEHPLSAPAARLAQHTSALLSEITAEMDGREVVVAGMVHDARTRLTRAGKTFLSVQLEDLSGSQEVTVWPDVYEPTRELWQAGNIVLTLLRVRERGDRLTLAAQQVSLVQAADGSVSHEHFEIPEWLTDAVRTSAGVGLVRVERSDGDAPPVAGGAPVPGEAPRAHNGHGANGAEGGGSPAPAPTRTLRFTLHESDDADEDRRRLDALVALLERHPGGDRVRLFVHARDGDKIELSLPSAIVTEELRTAGLGALGPRGGAEPIREETPRRTRGIEPLEVA
jgi:DNA polymerase-3 subunit alpha